MPYLTHNFSKYVLTALLAFSLMTLMASLSMIMPADFANLIFQEHGLIETVTVILCAICIIMLVFKNGVQNITAYGSIILLTGALALRELDFDKKFTTEGILKSKFLFSGDVPVMEKVIGGLILLVLISAVVHLLIKYARRYWHDIMIFKSYAWALVFGFGFMVLSKSIDGIGRKLNSFQLSITEYTDQLIQRCEEIYELGIPLAFILSIFLYQRSDHANRS